MFERELSRTEQDRDHKRRRVRPLGRSGIRRYVRMVRQSLFDTDFDPGEEIRLAYERLVRAFQIAATKENVGGMVKAQREISRIFGLGQGEVSPDSVSIEKVREQVRQMDLSIGCGLGDQGSKAPACSVPAPLASEPPVAALVAS